jgi:OPA family glycerol-3-phosphate transporter-like MFS transporter
MSTQAEVLITSQTYSNEVHSKTFNFYRNTTFVSLMAGYAGYYLCRQNLGVAYGPMKDSLGIDAIQFGWISSIGTLTYAIGKVSVGSLADSNFGGRTLFFLGLFASALFCLAFGFGQGLGFFLVTWAINRFFQSMGWSGLVNVMSKWFSRKTYGTAMGFMSISYQFGAALASLYAGMILSMGGDWRALFTIPALTLILLGLLILPFLKQSPESVGLSLKEDQIPKQSTATKSGPTLPSEDLNYIGRFALLLSNRAFVAMLGLSFILTFLRECFNIWMPAYFSEMGEKANIAAFKSTIFPFLGCIGTMMGGWISDRFFSGRRSPVMATLMILLIFCLVGLGNLNSLSHWSQIHLGNWFSRSNVAAILVGACGFFLLGSYSFVGGVVALDFGGKKTAGTASGLLDGFGYLGATLAGIGVANVVILSGWSFTFLIMAGCVFVGILFCIYLWNISPEANG